MPDPRRSNPAPEPPAREPSSAPPPDQGGGANATGRGWIGGAIQALGFLRSYQVAGLVLVVALIYGGGLLRTYFQGQAEQAAQRHRQWTEFYEMMLKDNERQRARVREMEIRVYRLTSVVDSLLTLHYQCRRSLSWCYEAVQNLREQIQQLSITPVEPAPPDFGRYQKKE